MLEPFWRKGRTLEKISLDLAPSMGENLIDKFCNLKDFTEVFWLKIKDFFVFRFLPNCMLISSEQNYFMHFRCRKPKVTVCS